MYVRHSLDSPASHNKLLMCSDPDGNEVFFPTNSTRLIQDHHQRISSSKRYTHT